MTRLTLLTSPQVVGSSASRASLAGVGISQSVPGRGFELHAAYGMFFTPVDMNAWCNQRHNVPYVFPETKVYIAGLVIACPVTPTCRMRSGCSDTTSAFLSPN
jgi:hypothetical protein